MAKRYRPDRCPRSPTGSPRAGDHRQDFARVHPYTDAVLDYLQAIVLGIIQGLTEFLRISSSAHLRIFPEWSRLGAIPGRRSPAVIQIGAELAVVIFFRHDIWRIATTWPAVPLQAGVPRTPRRPVGLVRHSRLAADRDPRRSSSRT